MYINRWKWKIKTQWTLWVYCFLRKKVHKFFEVHQQSENTGEHLRKPLKLSKKAFLCLKKQYDDVYEHLKQNLPYLCDIPVQWHSKCYESCTSSQNLWCTCQQKCVFFIQAYRDLSDWEFWCKCFSQTLHRFQVLSCYSLTGLFFQNENPQKWSIW